VRNAIHFQHLELHLPPIVGAFQPDDALGLLTRQLQQLLGGPPSNP
jgi:hypothetical protein